MFNPDISQFSNARNPVPVSTTTLIDALQAIKDGTYRDIIEGVRSEPDKKKRAELKKKLPAVTFSGLFAKRNAESLVQYSNIVCHDIDELEPAELTRLIDLLKNCPYLLAMFVSPSGNGLKLLFDSDHTDISHLEVWTAIGNYLTKAYNVIPDAACKDICRLCFLSYDTDLYYNEDCESVNFDILTQPFRELLKQSAAQPKAATKPGTKAPVDYAAKCHEIVSKTVTPGDGNYNAYINQFAIQANRYGLDEYDTLNAICYHCGWAAPDKEDKAVVKSVFEKFQSEKGNYLQSNGSPKPATIQPEKPKADVVIAHPDYDTSVLFWYVVGKVNKDTGEVVINPQTGEVMGEYKYSYDDAITFLENNGFYKYKVGEGYQFIHVDMTNKHVEIVNELRIKEFMITFLKSDDSIEYKRVREMFRRGAKNYCSTGILEGLSYYNPLLTRDTATNAYIYFQNCFLDISKEGIAANPYTAQRGYIWKKQMLDFKFSECAFDTSDVNLFVWYAITGRKALQAERTPEELQKYRSICSTIGYTLHRYKSPALTKAVITTDKKLRSTGENNGRSGKSLVIKLIGKMLNVVTIDGRNFSFDKEFNLQKVNIDTALINFDDVKPNFDFSRLFSMITEEFSFEKKRIDLITIPFADAPKFWISSNSTLKGGGESAMARQQIIEFSSYFNSNHQPSKEFGRMFFFDWDNAEWQRYYSFMVHCVKLYLECGLIDFPLENYGLNKLIDTAGEEFVDYMDDTIMAQLQHNNEYDSLKLYETFLPKINSKYPIKKNTFSKWVKMWAELHGLLINHHKQDGRDRRNGVDYLIFTKATPDAIPESDDKLPF